MNETTIQDLKQYIAATVSGQVSDLRTDIQYICIDIKDIRTDIQDIRTDIQQLDEKLTTKIDDLAQSVAEAMDNSNESTDTQLLDHEGRISRLEQKTA